MPSATLRKMQDEAAELDKTIATLRAMEPKDDEDRKSIEERLDTAMKRADEVAAIAEREQDLDRRQAKIAAILGSGSPKPKTREGEGEGEKRKVVQPFSAGKRSFYSSEEAKEGVGLALRSLARGEIRVGEKRDALGSTSPTYDGAGAEFIVDELANTVLNVIDYKSVFAMLAMPAEVPGNTLLLTKMGDIDCDFVDENTDPDDSTPTTDRDPLVVYDLRAWVPVSNNTLEDSPISVANTIERYGFTSFAKKIDNVALNGHVGKDIDGILSLVEGTDREFDVDGDPVTATVIGEMIGSVEDILNDPVWLVSSVGWGQLVALYGSQLGNGVIGNGRPVKTILGDPIVKVKGLPAGTLAVYGDFGSSTAFGYKPRGLTITALRELGRKKNQTIFDMIQRVGILNHAPEFCAVLKDSTLAGS